MFLNRIDRGCIWIKFSDPQGCVPGSTIRDTIKEWNGCYTEAPHNFNYTKWGIPVFIGKVRVGSVTYCKVHDSFAHSQIAMLPIDLRVATEYNFDDYFIQPIIKDNEVSRIELVKLMK